MTPARTEVFFPMPYGSMLAFVKGPVWGAFKAYLHVAKSHRNRTPLSQSSINTYHSSIKIFLLTYLRGEPIDVLWNGHVDAILALERSRGNNANFSMQQCAFRHFYNYMEPHRPSASELRPFTKCPECLCARSCVRCHAGTHAGVSRCFGKCSKLVSSCKLNDDGICAYCLEKYPILYAHASRRRSRYLEYVNDHALIGRPYDPTKHDRMIRKYILESLRWYDRSYEE